MVIHHQTTWGEPVGALTIDRDALLEQLSGILVSDNAPTADVLKFYPNFPKLFVVTLTQTGTGLTGTMAAGGLTRTFTFPGSVSNPRRMSFGVETFQNVWAPQDGDFYFGLTLDESLTSATGAARYYCGSSVAHKR